jgi:hypothetical protein
MLTKASWVFSNLMMFWRVMVRFASISSEETCSGVKMKEELKEVRWGTAGGNCAAARGNRIRAASFDMVSSVLILALTGDEQWLGCSPYTYELFLLWSSCLNGTQARETRFVINAGMRRRVEIAIM